jgi:hypothetical protein
MSQTSTRGLSRPGHSPAPVPAPVRPPYGVAAGVGGVVFALYAVTLGPSTAFWDTSEYIATAHILGVPHPPGNPPFLLMARAWELLLAPTGLSVAVRINLFSAFMSAGAAAFWFLVVHRVLSFFTAEEAVRKIGAGAAVLVSATAFTVWNQSNVNEKVYTVSLLTIALLSWLAFLWRDHVEQQRALPAGQGVPARGWHDGNVLVLMVFILALSVSNHLMAFLAAPALVLFLFLIKPQVFLHARLYAWGAVFAIIGLSVQVYLPIRAGFSPVINEADPSCRTLGEALVSIISFGNAGCDALSSVLQREQYAKPSVLERQAPFGAQLANFFQYFDWQWARSLQGSRGYLAPARLPFTLLFVGLGLYGAWQHWRRERISFAYLATLFATLSLGLVFYMNFEYGFGQVQARGLPFELAEVRERDYFFLVSFSLWGLWAGLGITLLWLRAVETLGGWGRAAALKASPVLLLALLPLVLNWPYASRTGDYAARDWAYNLLQSVEPYGVLFTNGDNDTFPLWYLQEVEGIRQDVTVLVGTYLNTDWYPRQARDLTRSCPAGVDPKDNPTRIICQRAFQADQAPDLYSDRPKPTDTILPLSDAQIAATTQSYVRLPQDVVFEARGLRATLGAETFLTPADQFTLAIIKNAWGDRPIHFSAAQVPQSLGLGEFIARHGLTYKLVTPEETAALLPMPQNQPYSWAYGAFLDTERTQKLLWDVFQYRDLIDRPVWTDDATRNIPSYYIGAHIALAQAETMLGNDEAARRNASQAERWAALAAR